MSLEKVAGSFSRIMNGNFSHGLAYWEARIEAEHLRSSPYSGGERDDDFTIAAVPPSQTSPSSQEEVPLYGAKFTGSFWHYVQYKDLAVFPSSLIVKEESLGYNRTTAMPGTYGEYLLRAAAPPPLAVPSGHIEPFGMVDDQGDLVAVIEPGSTMVITDQAAGLSAEARAGTVIDPYLMTIGIADPINLAFTSADFAGAQYKKETPVPPAPSDNSATVRVLGDVTTATRADGGTGVGSGDYFVSKYPTGSGRITGSSFDGTYTTLTLLSEVVQYRFEETNAVWIALTDWYIAPRFEVEVARDLPVALYELTVSFTVEDSYNIVLEQTSLLFLDELDQSASDRIISATNIRIDSIGDHRSRVTALFRKQVLEPYYGSVTLMFTQGDAFSTRIYDVAMWKGDYTGEVTPLASFDSLKDSIVEESGAVPRGIIIAYTGGSACPAGFIQWEGLGGENARALGAGDDLVIDLATLDSGTFVSATTVESDTGKRTTLELGPNALRDLGLVPLPRHQTGRTVAVTPYDVSLFPLHVSFRGIIGNPDPHFVEDDGIIRADYFPGCILEIRSASQNTRIFAIISQVFQGNLVTAVVEGVPDAAGLTQQYLNELIARWYRSSRTDKNAFWQAYQSVGQTGQTMKMYGDFDIVREYHVRIELIGDFSESIPAMVNDAELYVWKSGVVAHAQKLEDMKDSPLYKKNGFGGFGYVADPHSHQVKAVTDGVETDNVAVPEGDFEVGPVPAEHTHFYLFGAVSIPKVRPVLLCQKL